MNIKEYNDMDLPIRWGIVLYDYPPDTDEEDIELDIRATAPDGTYEVVSDNNFHPNPFNLYKKAKGVVVKDGEFDVEATAKAIAELADEVKEGDIVASPMGDNADRRPTLRNIWYNPVGKYFKANFSHY